MRQAIWLGSRRLVFCPLLSVVTINVDNRGMYSLISRPFHRSIPPTLASGIPAGSNHQLQGMARLAIRRIRKTSNEPPPTQPKNTRMSRITTVSFIPVLLAQLALFASTAHGQAATDKGLKFFEQKIRPVLRNIATLAIPRMLRKRKNSRPGCSSIPAKECLPAAKPARPW